MRSNDTLVDTPFQLISDFFMLIRVFCVAAEALLNKLPPGAGADPGIEGGRGRS